MTPPLFEERALDSTAVDAALRGWGGFMVRPTSAAALDRMLSLSREFFSLGRADKAALAIEHSPHFRGWSEMHNKRDWREQLHLGRERPAAGSFPPFRRLEGPNLWPNDPAWRAGVSGYMDFVADLGARILDAIARHAGVDPACLGLTARDGYLIAKLIGYHPQPSAVAVRSGVAPHVDFSWLTINLQDSDGLEVRLPDGQWTKIDGRPGVVWIHVGELLEHATSGRYQATPHRVINRSPTRMRVSVPVFVNPPLDALVPLFPTLPEARRHDPDPSEHVHRVLARSREPSAFHFGGAEWERKGLGGWCFSCQPTARPFVACTAYPGGERSSGESNFQQTD